MKIAQQPEPAQIQTLMQGPEDSPVVMLNLLSFKESADTGNDADNDADNEGISGRESYMRYAEKMQKFVESKDGRFLWTGRVDSMLIGESDVDFQVVALVEYPNRKTFLEVASSAHVQEIGKHRSRGLAGQWLVAMTETNSIDSMRPTGR